LFDGCFSFVPLDLMQKLLWCHAMLVSVTVVLNVCISPELIYTTIHHSLTKNGGGRSTRMKIILLCHDHALG
jgi:hypothetical protein